MKTSIEEQVKEFKDKDREKLPLGSAGRLMISEIPVMSSHATISDIEKLFLRDIKKFETINYIYIVDKHKKLKGVLSVKDIFRLPKTMQISQALKNEEVISARVHTDQEHIALLALKHNIKAIPITDKDGHLLGVVPGDVILQILNNEQIEDILKFAGIGNIDNTFAGEIMDAPARTHFLKRIPWLIAGLFGGMMAAFVIEKFESVLREELLLAAFIPLVVYMADAIGTQTQMIFIRSMATDRRFKLKKYLGRETKVGLLLAVTLGVLLSGLALAIWDSQVLSVVLGLSLFATTIIAVAIAVSMPWIFQKRGYDPAIASGPFATIIRDILSVLIYLTIAFLALNIF